MVVKMIIEKMCFPALAFVSVIYLPMQELDEFNNLLQYNYLGFLTFHNCPPIVHEIFETTNRGQIFAEFLNLHLFIRLFCPSPRIQF